MEDSGWKEPGAAEKYMEIVDVVAPGRKEIVSIIARLAVNAASEQPRFLDIGCGMGIVTDEILKLCPNASVTMLDFSEEMVRFCRERFQGCSNISVIRQDLNEGLGLLVAGQYDAVVSCFALHHVAVEKRVSLYREILQALKPSGVFCNGDLFKGDSPWIHEWEFDHYIEWMRDQLREKMGHDYSFTEMKARQMENYRVMKDMPGTVWDMYHDLREAGFRYADCLCKYQNLGVIAAANC